MSVESRNRSNILGPVMSQKTFNRLSRFIEDRCGIKMPPGKKTMLEGRLRKRLRSLEIDSFDSYCKYLFEHKGLEEEYLHMINVVTTNKTDFFREASHFDYLRERVLPEITRKGCRFTVWSAGCSTGEEPYTLAMVLSEFAKEYDCCFEILGTDISTVVLEKARKAIYEHERVEPVPMLLRKKYLLRGKGEKKDLVRVKPELRCMVEFRRVNLMEDRLPVPNNIAVIFCRNVMIYFDRATQEEVVSKFCLHLMPGGYLFTGHSETLNGLDLPLVSVAPTVHKRL
jgi:chemotaxis protein methyltransferase CheR